MNCEGLHQSPVMIEVMGDAVFTCPAKNTWTASARQKMSMVIKLTSVERICKGITVPVAAWGTVGEIATIDIDTRPESTQYQSLLNEAIDPGFILIIFEVANAIQDELYRTGRRDSRGRLVQSSKKSLMSKAMTM